MDVSYVEFEISIGKYEFELAKPIPDQLTYCHYFSSSSTWRSCASKKTSFTLLNLPNNWMESIALERLFLLPFLSVAKKEVGRRDSFEKSYG